MVLKKLKKPAKATTPTFILTIGLAASSKDEQQILIRFDVGRQVWNLMVQHGRKLVGLIRQSKDFHRACRMPKGKERTELFWKVRNQYGFNRFAFNNVVLEHRKASGWIGDHLTAQISYDIASRVFKAIDRWLLRLNGKPRFKRKIDFLDSLSAPSAEQGIRWKGDHIEWSGLRMRALIDQQDETVIYGLKHRIKFCRVTRKNIRGRNFFYVQLILEGTPLVRHKLGEGIVGLDDGPSTIAAVSETAARLEEIAPTVAKDNTEIRLLQRKLDRSQRASNPDNYNADGTIKKREKGQPRIKMEHSKRYLRTQGELAELHRLRAEHRKSENNHLANQILSMGNEFHMEKISAGLYQRMYGRSVATRSPGGMTQALFHKAESAGGKVVLFNPQKPALSQSCVCGSRHKKELSQRVHDCSCGVYAQRDLFSAFLARFVDEQGTLHTAQALKAWASTEPFLRAAWSDAVEAAISRGYVPSSFGRPKDAQSQSSSPAESGYSTTKVSDV